MRKSVPVFTFYVNQGFNSFSQDEFTLLILDCNDSPFQSFMTGFSVTWQKFLDFSVLSLLPKEELTNIAK